MRRPLVLGAAVLTIVLVLVAVTVGERVAYSGEVLPGVAVPGVDIAGDSEDAAREELRGLARRLEREPVRARAGSTDLAFDPKSIAFEVEVDTTVEAAQDSGRGNVVAQVFGTVLRRLRDDEVPLSLRWSEAKLSRELDAWSEQLSQGLQSGGLRFEGATVTEVAPVPGIGLKLEEAERRIVRELRSTDRAVVRLPVGQARPPVDHAQVKRAAAKARLLLSAPIELLVNEVPVTIAPEQLGNSLTATPRGRRLVLGVDAAKLREQIQPALSSFEREPVDAEFTVSGGGVAIVPSQSGLVVDLDSVAPAILRGERRIPTALVERQPERTTQHLESLNIVEQVSSFTTEHPAGQERVKNIHRACDLVSGTIVEPGETFSLNDALGPRTPERGFVLAPAFSTQEGFFDAYGGGVSQFSTTLFNATFFGGYKDVAHTPHTIYISRYPMGREATLDYPAIDNRFQNDSGSGVLITCSYTSSSITVTYFGNKEGKTVRAEGPVVLEEIPIEIEYVETPFLPPGQERPADGESGYTGYRVENYRIITQPGQPDRREVFRWKYDMRTRKILRGAPAAPPPTILVPVTPEEVPPAELPPEGPPPPPG
jgi:vancomycin resistance protein YoaR